MRLVISPGHKRGPIQDGGAQLALRVFLPLGFRLMSISDDSASPLGRLLLRSNLTRPRLDSGSFLFSLPKLALLTAFPRIR